MVWSSEHQLHLPNDFPVDEMVAFMAAARSITLSPTKSNAWVELGGASNLIAWRFRACHEDMSRYTESCNGLGFNISFEEMYLREKALFGMFTAGVSCIESACYALHALVSHQKLLALPFGEHEQRSCNPTRLKERLAKYSEAKALAAALDVLIRSTEWNLWVTLRNRMIHRSNLPRIVRGAVGIEPPPARMEYGATSSTTAFEADETHLEAMFVWLSESLRTLLIEGHALASRV